MAGHWTETPVAQGNKPLGAVIAVLNGGLKRECCFWRYNTYMDVEFFQEGAKISFFSFQWKLLVLYFQIER